MQEREREEAKERAKEHEAQRAAEARRRETLRIVESTVKAEVAERRNKDSDPLGENIEPFGPVCLKDEMAFQDEIFRPGGENQTLKFVLRPKQFVPK